MRMSWHPLTIYVAGHVTPSTTTNDKDCLNSGFQNLESAFTPIGFVEGQL